MSSENKKNKLKNSYCVGALKNKNLKLKRILFYNASKRQEEKRQLRNYED